MPVSRGCPDPDCDVHGHPSRTCYIEHGCRCRACKRVTVDLRACSRTTKPLDDATLRKLRRSVGLPEELPAEGFRVT